MPKGYCKHTTAYKLDQPNLVKYLLSFVAAESLSHKDFQRQPGELPSFTGLKRFSTDALESGLDRCQIERQPEGGSLLKSEDLKFSASHLAPIGGHGRGDKSTNPNGEEEESKKIIYCSLLRYINAKILPR